MQIQNKLTLEDKVDILNINNHYNFRFYTVSIFFLISAYAAFNNLVYGGKPIVIILYTLLEFFWLYIMIHINKKNKEELSKYQTVTLETPKKHKPK